MDITGSIWDATGTMSVELQNAVAGVTGSSAIDTILETIVNLPGLALSVAGLAGRDIGSSPIVPFIPPAP